MMTMTNERQIFKWLAVIVVIFLAVEIIYYVLFLDTWFDEAEYGYKPWLVSQDLGQPFQDFRVKYPPLVFYIQVAFQGLFGPTILGVRIFSALLLALIGWLLFLIGKRLGDKWTGLISLSLLTFQPYLVGFFSSAKDYSLAIVFPLLALWILSANIETRNKVIISSIFMTLSVLIRYNMLPVLIALWLFFIWRWKSWRYLGASIVISGLIFAVSFIPYLLLDAKYSLIWTAIMFGPLTKIFPVDYFQTFISPTGGAFSVEHLKFLIGVFIKYFHLWVIFLAALLIALRQWKKVATREFLEKNSLLAFNFFLTLLFFTSHFLIPNEFATQPKFLYFAPFMILAVTGSIALLLRRLQEKNTLADLKLPLGIFLAVLIVFPAVSIALTEPQIIFFNRFNYQDTDLNRVKRGGEYLRSLTQPEDKILAIGTPHHPFLAGRYEIPELINGEFTYYEIENEKLLNRYKFYNFSMLIDWLTNNATVAVFQKDALAESSVFSNDPNKIDLFRQILNERYDEIGQINNVYPRKYTRSGVMQVYRKKI